MGANERLFSRFIPREQQGEAANWEFQPLHEGGAGAATRGAEKLLSDRERRAYERGRLEGMAAGRQAALAQRAQTAQQIERVLDQLRGRFAELESAGADRLLDLAVTLASQVLRRQIEVDRSALLPPLRDAIAAVIDQNTHPRVHLNPQDHALLRDELEADGLFRGCRFIADPAITRGGCRVETAQCEIDATLETRIERVLAAVGLGAAGGLMQPALFNRLFEQAIALAATAQPQQTRGRLTRVAGLVMEAVGLKLPLGSQVQVVQDESLRVDAEVVGFAGDRLFLMPTVEPIGLRPGALVLPHEAPSPRPQLHKHNHGWRRAEDRTRHLPMGDALLGRVVDPNGRPLDKLGALDGEPRPLARRPINAMEREPVREPMDVGVRAINALLTVGRGQRMGLFAGSGVGKSVLLGMMAKYTSADVTVVGLIGERGREVKEFIEDILGPDGLRRAVVVAAPADVPPLLRMQGAAYATAIAEHFRDQGKQVLLLFDSLTRYAMAAREIALAIGEPPATKGYPPSVFARLPALVERAGNGSSHGAGSITGFYTVLTEGDDPQDPVADAARAILDGHVVLSRRLAEAGHYPAIDIEASISRVMTAVAGPDQIDLARRFKALYSAFSRNRDLLAVGAYVPGNDRQLDAAIAAWPRIEAFLQQGMDEASSLAEAHGRLAALLATIPTP